jgi:Ca2+-binding EF-hand superfamily protein
MIDLSSDGSIDLDELHMSLVSVGITTLTKDTLEAYFESIGVTDGDVSVAEFIDLVTGVDINATTHEIPARR